MYTINKVFYLNNIYYKNNYYIGTIILLMELGTYH